MVLKLSQLRNFKAVVESGAARQAAKTLNLSQSAITKSVRQLEDELGVELLNRGTNGVAPTEAGKAPLAHAKIIESELRHARNDVEAIQGAGDIRVSVSPSVATGLLPSAVIAFQRKHPRVSGQNRRRGRWRAARCPEVVQEASVRKNRSLAPKLHQAAERRTA